MELLWWHWLILGMVLIGLELIVPSFTIIWFGLGAVLVSIILAISPGYSPAAQILTWTVASALCTLACLRFFKPRTNKTSAGASKGAVIGEIGLVTRAAEPHGKGVVKFQLPLLGADEWPCISGKSLEVGDRVRVIEVEGDVMRVANTAKKENL